MLKIRYEEYEGLYLKWTTFIGEGDTIGIGGSIEITEEEYYFIIKSKIIKERFDQNKKAPALTEATHSK